MPLEYLELEDYLLIAEAVLGVPAERLAEMPHLVHLADSALAVPKSGWGGQDAYPEFAQKAALMCARLVRNHPLWDGNKRTATHAMFLLLHLSGYTLRPIVHRAGTRIERLNLEIVEMVLGVADSRLSFDELVDWFKDRVIPAEDRDRYFL